jgi:hypothetical protein
MTDRPGRRTRLDPATRRDQILHAAVELFARATRAEVHALTVSATVTLMRELAPAVLAAAEPPQIVPGSVLEPDTTPRATTPWTSARPSSGP